MSNDIYCTTASKKTAIRLKQLVLTRKSSIARRNGARGNKGSYSNSGAAHQPSVEEIQYLEAAEYGDIPTVQKLLTESKNLNVNCVDYMGQNALQLACGNEHLEIVELLVKQPEMSRIGDALLLAISRGFLRITEAILNHPSFCNENKLIQRHNELIKSSSQEKDFYAYDDNGTRFSPDITPIILAAQCQEFDIVYELLRRGAKIERPHSLRCRCGACQSKKNSDSLSFCLSRLNAYKGLASPAYLAHATPYPAKEAFELSHRLNKLSTIEKEFKNDYLKLAQQCNDFVERLLDVCYNTEEVNAMLNGRDYAKSLSKKTKESQNARIFECTGDTVDNPRLQQLRIAIKYKVKKFVAHPYCQQKVIEIWHKNSEGFSQRPVFQKLLFAIILSFFMPVFVLMYLIDPGCRVGRNLQSPYCKFVTQAIAYAQFVLLLVINCADRMEGIKEFADELYLVPQTESNGRYVTFTWCEYAIMIYIAGLLWNEMKELWSDGPREYMFKLWNVVDSFMLLILIASFTARAISYHSAYVGQNWWKERFGENASLVYCNINNTNYFLFHKKLDIDVPAWADYYAYCKSSREFWTSLDPQLIAEGLYSFGIVLSFSRISYILEVNDKFGPLQISLGRTVSDIMKWCGIFFMIFGAFLLGLFNLYSFYGEKGAKRTKSFTTLEETFITLFWSLFGLSDYRVVEINYGHLITRSIGYQLYGAYNIITVVVMLNMLIAMINSSYAEVEGDSDVEWKFARAEMMLSYFEKGNTLPVPYNLLPVPRMWLGCLINAVSGKKINERKDEALRASGRNFSNKRHVSESCDDIPGSSNSKSYQGSFERVMAKIVKRYVLKAQIDKSKDAEITEAELHEIKQDICSLRYEILGNTNTTEKKMKDLEKIMRCAKICGCTQPSRSSSDQKCD